MTKIKIAFVAPILLVSLVWLFTNTLVYMPFDSNLFTKSLDQYTGILAFSAMTFVMILATRSVWIEKRLGGLDKVYRLHKWFGIAAFSFSILHWLAVVMPGWLDLENMILLDAIAGATQVVEATPIEEFFELLEPSAIIAGEYAFYLTVLFLLITLIKKIPYRIFAKSHIAMAIIYLVLVYHAFSLMYIDYWTEPIGITMALLMVTGTISAFMVLTGLVGKKRKAEGSIEAINTYPEMDMFELVVKSDKWKGHREGQFAFLKFEKSEPPHPFTISSAWNKESKKISFTIKALGDYTSALADKVNIGDSIVLEGAYGDFTFDDNKDNQIWIAGGVGVTPFIARMERLAQQNTQQQIDFFYTAVTIDSKLKSKLQELSTAANVNLHLIETAKTDRLSGEQIRNTVSNWKMASVWFCGHSKMGASIKKDLKNNGFTAEFEQELFEMR